MSDLDYPWYANETMRAAHAIFVEKLADRPEIQRVLLEGYRVSCWCWRHKIVDLSKLGSYISIFIIENKETTNFIPICLKDCKDMPSMNTPTLEDARKTTDYFAKSKSGLKVVNRYYEDIYSL